MSTGTRTSVLPVRKGVRKPEQTGLRRRHLAPYLVMVPALLFLLAVSIVPLLYSLVVSLLRFRRYPQVVEAMQTTKPRPLFPEEERWEQVVSVPLHAIQLGEMTVEEGLAKAQDDVNRMMMELGYY